MPTTSAPRRQRSAITSPSAARKTAETTRIGHCSRANRWIASNAVGRRRRGPGCRAVTNVPPARSHW
ncbi:Uncharacterised protein [Mycobacteroides abscessus subsp. abscessus]|nr:Uncharacterised protein [Mycobacteroides abscessus subsp. abscessus]